MINLAILKRRSVREFTDQKVSKGQILEIIKAAQFSPTAMNNRAWEFLVLEDQVDKDKLFEVMDSNSRQEQVKTASVVLIPVMNTNKSVLPVQDLSIAIENIFIQVTEMGLGSFWKNILPSEADDIRAAFKIPDNYRLLASLPIGYPAREAKDHSDTEFDETKIHWNQW